MRMLKIFLTGIVPSVMIALDKSKKVKKKVKQGHFAHESGRVRFNRALPYQGKAVQFAVIARSLSDKAISRREGIASLNSARNDSELNKLSPAKV